MNPSPLDLFMQEQAELRRRQARTTWLRIVGLFLGAGGMVAFYAYADGRAREQCQAKGGQLVETRSDAFCVRKGVLIP